MPTVVVTYGSLIDGSIPGDPAAPPEPEEGQDYIAKGWFAPDCAYPLRCVVGAWQTSYAAGLVPNR